MVGQFSRDAEQMKGKVTVVLNRRQRVHSNRENQAVYLENNARKLAAELKSRLQKHTQRKSVLQLERIKAYKNMNIDWKSKVAQISMTMKNEDSKKLQKSKLLNKQIQQFWENRYSPKKSSSKGSIKPSRENSPKGIRPYQSQFLTEVRLSKESVKDKRNARSVIDSVEAQKNNSSSRLRRDGAVSCSINIKRRRTEGVEPHRERFELQWKKKEDQCFQQAMQKIDIILKKRVKAMQKINEHKVKSKEYRLFKQQSMFHQDRRHHNYQREEHYSLHEERHRTQQRKQISKPTIVMTPNRNSIVELRRRRLQEEGFSLRGEVFGRERFKQRRGKFHRMVREAVNVFRLQAMRHKN